jgi:hypothetical protein
MMCKQIITMINKINVCCYNFFIILSMRTTPNTNNVCGIDNVMYGVKK